MQGRKQFQTKLYHSVNLDTLVPQDNYYRKLNSVLDLEWVRKQTKCYYGSEGQMSIDPVVFVKVLLVGYLNNIGSDRRLMEECGNRLDVRLFLGYDIDEALPWHSTISRTRQLWGEQVFLTLFQKVLGMCVSKGMVRGKRQAMDAAPVKANASMDSLLEKEIEADAVAYAQELDKGSQHSIAPVQTEAPTKTAAPTVNQYKKRRIEKHHEWKKEAYKGQPGHGDKHEGTDDNGNLIRGKFLSNHTHYSPTDPDSRISVKPGKARQMNYHAQVSVDDNHHVITCAMAALADKRDSQMLPTLIDATQVNLSQHGIVMHQVLADAGYSSGTALRHCQAKGLEAYIPNFGQYKPHREGFIYNQNENRYECQRGNKAILPYKREMENHDGHRMHIYRSSSKDCRECPLRATCIGKSDFKAITHSVDKELYDAMHQRMQTPKAQGIMRRRGSTVEPVLGSLINYTNMRRVNTRGIANANKHILLASLAYNLKKYMKTPWRRIKVLEMPKQTLSKSILASVLGHFGLVLSPYKRYITN